MKLTVTKLEKLNFAYLQTFLRHPIMTKNDLKRVCKMSDFEYISFMAFCRDRGLTEPCDSVFESKKQRKIVNREYELF